MSPGRLPVLSSRIRAPEAKKVCLTCRRELPVSEFYKHLGGRQSRCKKCDNFVRAYGLKEAERVICRGEVPAARTTKQRWVWERLESGQIVRRAAT